MSRRHKEEDIKAILLVTMYLDPQFKKAPMLTVEMKTSIKSFMNYKLEVCILNDRRLSQAEDSMAEQGESSISERQSRAKGIKLEKFLVILLLEIHQKKSVLQRLQKQGFKSMS